MTISSHNKRTFLSLLSVCLIAAIPAAVSAQENTLSDAPGEPRIATFNGGYYIEWPELTEVGSVQLNGSMTGPVEMMFDIRMQDIERKPTPSKNPDVLLPLADYWIVRGKPAHAIPLYRRGLENDPENLLFQNNLAMLLSTVENNHNGGLDIINGALETKHDNVTLLDSKGLILMNAGRVDEAIPPLERAVELSCQFPIYVLHLTQAYDMAGRENSARNWFDKVRPLLEATPNQLSKENKDMFDNLRMKYGASASE